MYLKNGIFMKKYDPDRQLVFFPANNENMSNAIFLDYFGHGFILKVKIMVKIVISMHNLIFLTTCHYTTQKHQKSGLKFFICIKMTENDKNAQN